MASTGMSRVMSDTAIWRAGVLGQESTERPKISPKHFTFNTPLSPPSNDPQATSTSAGKPPYAPPFEVAKLPVGLTSAALASMGTGSSSMGPVPCSRGSGRSSGQGSAPSSGMRQCQRASSQGRLPQQHVDSRMAVSHAHPDILERHPDSLMARARAPAPLPRFVAPPQGSCQLGLGPPPKDSWESQLKYAPPPRDSWEYDKVGFPKDVVQVVRLESKPYVRKNPREPEQEIFSRRRRAKINGLSNVYGPLVQTQQRQPPRVQSLPTLPSSRSPQLSRLEAQSLIHGSPQRLAAIS